MTIQDLFIYKDCEIWFMVGDNFCHCGSCGHEKIDECYTKQCACCLTDHQGPFGKNR